MRHLRALAQAGLTDVHLLPVFDFASVPERGCITPRDRRRARPTRRSRPRSSRARPATASTGATTRSTTTRPKAATRPTPTTARVRVREFRAMVQALHRAGLRVGMDVVYNHTAAAGQNAQSVLDRVVPGYYQRLDAQRRRSSTRPAATTPPPRT